MKREELKKEAILFGKYLANSVNTETWDVDDVEREVPKLYDEYLHFSGRDNEISEQKPKEKEDEIKPCISTYPEKFQRWVYDNIADGYSDDYLAFLFSMYDEDYDRLKSNQP